MGVGREGGRREGGKGYDFGFITFFRGWLSTFTHMHYKPDKSRSRATKNCAVNKTLSSSANGPQSVEVQNYDTLCGPFSHGVFTLGGLV